MHTHITKPPLNALSNKQGIIVTDKGVHCEKRFFTLMCKWARANKKLTGSIDVLKTTTKMLFHAFHAGKSVNFWVSINIFMSCPTSFFSNQIQTDEFEKKLVGQNMNI